MNTYYQRPILSPGGAFSFGLFDGPQVGLGRHHLREAYRKGRVLACLGWAGKMKASVSSASRRHSLLIRAPSVRSPHRWVFAVFAREGFFFFTFYRL